MRIKKLSPSKSGNKITFAWQRRAKNPQKLSHSVDPELNTASFLVISEVNPGSVYRDDRTLDGQQIAAAAHC